MTQYATPPIFTHTRRCPTPRGVYALAACAANLLLVPDVTTGTVGGLPAVQVPATSATPTAFAGVSDAAIGAGRTGDVAVMSGDVVACISSGTTAKGDRVTVDTHSGKEGWALTTTTAGDLMVGVVLDGGADGTTIWIELFPKLKDS